MASTTPYNSIIFFHQAEKEVEYQLFRLYYNENDIQSLEQEIENKRREVQKIEAKKDKAEEILKERKKEQGKASRELAKIEQEIREVVGYRCLFAEIFVAKLTCIFNVQEVEINKKRPSFIKSKERVAHIQKKLNSAKKSLEEVRRADEAHKKDIEELEQELAEVEAQRREYEDLLAGESQSQGRDVQLEDAQVCKLQILVPYQCSDLKYSDELTNEK